MAHLIQIPLEDSMSVYIEACDVVTNGKDPMFAPASSSNVITRSKEYMDELTKQIRSFSMDISKSIKGIADEVELEFAVKIGADAGVIISSVSTEASIKVSLKWKKGD